MDLTQRGTTPNVHVHINGNACLPFLLFQLSLLLVISQGQPLVHRLAVSDDTAYN